MRKSAQAAAASNLGAQAAFVVPLLYGLTRAAAHGYLNGSLHVLEASLSSSATGWSGPAALLARLCVLVPLGPLALRVAAASALALAAASLVLYRAIDTLLLAQGVGVAALRAPVALGLSLLAVAAPNLFFQGLRPEVFALQTLLALGFVERLSRLEARWPSHDLRPLYSAALCFGGLGATDPVCALLLLTAALPTLSRVARAKGLARLGACAAAALVVAVGARLGCVLTHEPFWPRLASSTHHAATAFAYPRAFFSELGLFTLWVVFGAVAALQTPGVRRIATLWTSVCVVPVLGYGLFGFAPNATDALGMLAYAPAATALLAAALCGALLAPDGVPKALATRAQLAAVFAVLALGGLRLHVSAAQSELVDFVLPDAWSGQLRHRLPTRGLLLASDAQTAGLLLAGEAEDRARPDVRVLAPARWHSSHVSRTSLPSEPELRPLVRAYLLNGELEQTELESLAGKRPVLLDAQPHLPPTLLRALRLDNFVFEVLGAAASQAEAKSAASAYRTELEQLGHALGTSVSDPAARPWLASQALSAALFFAASAEVESARAAIDFGRPLAPRTRVWDGLSAALTAQSAAKPVDVQPFLSSDLLSTEP